MIIWIVSKENFELDVRRPLGLQIAVFVVE